jgi:hypothetical protein
MVAGLRSLRLSTVIISAAVITLIFLPLTASTNTNHALLQPQSVFAQIQEEASGTTNTTTITNDTTATEPTDFLPYSNPTYGIFIQYPSDWTASTSGLTDYTDLIALYSPLEGHSQFFPARLSISVEQYAQNVSLQEYTEFVLAGLQNQSGVDVKNSSEVTIAGYPAHRLVLAHTPLQDNMLIVNSMSIWAAVGNRLYLLAYSGEQSSFNQHLPEVNQMLESLVIEQEEPS